MSKNGVSYQALYQLVDDRTNKIMEKFDGHEKRIVGLESWQSKVRWQLGMIAGVAGAIVSISVDWVKKRLNGV